MKLIILISTWLLLSCGKTIYEDKIVESCHMVEITIKSSEYVNVYDFVIDSKEIFSPGSQIYKKTVLQIPATIHNIKLNLVSSNHDKIYFEIYDLNNAKIITPDTLKNSTDEIDFEGLIMY